MIKKIIFFFILFLFLPPLNVGAQQKSERWVCLKAEKASSHTASVSINPEAKLLSNSDTYFFECLSDTECTSGDAALDQQVFSKNNLGEMGINYGYNFEGSSLPANPTMSDGTGEVTPFTWKSSTTDSHARRWLGSSINSSG